MSHVLRAKDQRTPTLSVVANAGNAGGVRTTETPAANMIEFRGISKSYGGSVALHGTDLAVRKGEFLSLLGPSGSGKSTILNIIAGAIAPTTGAVVLDGSDVSTVPPRDRGLGMVFQNYALLPHLNVFDNVAFPLRIRGLSNAEIKQRVRNALERVGLIGYEQRKPREMSGGQQQRVGIARCIVYSPSVILMDEPLGALDKKLRDQLQGEIKRLHRELGTTLVYVTHDQEEALNLSDRVCLMNGGRIAQLGTPDELYFEPVNEFVADFVGESNLIDGVIQADGTVRFDESRIMQVKSTQGHAVGSKVKVLVRPERVTVVGDGSSNAGASSGSCNGANDNECSGTISQISFVGGMTRLEVKLSSGRALLVKTLSAPAVERAPIGRSLTVRWSARDAVVLRK